MPGKIKVKVLAGRNLPVMDRASDTTDAFVEIKFGSVTHKTDVCRKSLNPHWNSLEWYRFEVDESELQDEPLQLRLMDHDTYSANDAIGKVVISLAPLLAREAHNTKGATGPSGGAVLSGWIPVFDTMHGIRGELNVIVKVELFSDFNKYKTSSVGVQFFHCATIPPGYTATAIHGFVEELVVNDDPEYQWIDKIRTPRASNEARQVAFIKLSNQVQRLVGLKAAELGANAVVGYQQDFDLEGEAGVVARAIGTAVSITPPPTPSQSINIPPCTQQELRKCLDILATDNESITDLNQYFQNHQDELHRLLDILNPKPPALLDDPEVAEDEEKNTLTRQSSIKSYTGSLSIYQDDYASQKSLKHISEDQTDLNRLLKQNDDSDSDSTGTLQKIKKIRTTLFSKRFGSGRTRKSEKQEDQISLQSNSSNNSRLSMSDIKNEFKKFKRLKKPKFRKTFVNQEDEGIGMASILARSVIHAHTSLACIAETQDSEHSPSSTMRKTSESEPTINVDNDDKAKQTSTVTTVENNKGDTNAIPETHTSLKNIASNESTTSVRLRKLSESCPATPMVERSENLLKLPREGDYYGSLSLSGDSSDVYSSSEEDDESSDQKTDTEKSVETTSSVVHSVLNNGVNPVFVAQMERKLSTMGSITSELKESKSHNDIKLEEVKSVQLESANSSPCIKKYKVESETENLGDSTASSDKSVQSTVTERKLDNIRHFKFHNPFSYKKVSKCFSAPSSPVDNKSFMYRSSKRIKQQFKNTKNSMMKSLSHYSLLPKKRHEDVKGTLSQPGSTSDVISKVPSQTVLGSPFLSYADLLTLDKDGTDTKQNLLKNDGEYSRVTMFIGSEPVSRASMSGPSLSSKDESYGFEAHKCTRKERTPSLKPTGLVQTAMETILIDKVESLLVPTSPDCIQSKEQQFFNDINLKLEKVEEARSQASPKSSHNIKTSNTRRSKDSLVHTAMETILMDKVQSLLTTPCSSGVNNGNENRFFPEVAVKTEPNDLLSVTSDEHQSADQWKTFSRDRSRSREKKEKHESLFNTAMKTILIDKVQALIPPSSEPIDLKDNFTPESGHQEQSKVDEISHSRRNSKHHSGLLHTAMETILMDKVQVLIPANSEPVSPIEQTPIHTHHLSEKNRSDEDDKPTSILHSAIETILLDKAQALLPTKAEPFKNESDQQIFEPRIGKPNTKATVVPNSLFNSTTETILLDKVPSLLPPTSNIIDPNNTVLGVTCAPIEDSVNKTEDSQGFMPTIVQSSSQCERLEKPVKIVEAQLSDLDNTLNNDERKLQKALPANAVKDKRLIRQDSVDSIQEGNEESQKMTKDICANIAVSSKATQSKPMLQHFHPILSGPTLETIPSLPESSLDHTESLDTDGVERTCDCLSECKCHVYDSETNSVSVCDNSHAACRFDRNDREKEKEKCDREKGSPRHARHESYGGREPVLTPQPGNASLNSSSTPLGIHRRSSDSDLSVTPKGGSLNASIGNTGSGGGAILRPSMNSNNLEMLEYPFLTMTEYPPGFIVHIGGTVCARSVKLVDAGGESAARAAWWAELRTELRAHARALRCNAVIAYTESAAICEDVCVLSASGTAALINLDCDFSADFDVWSSGISGSKTAVDDAEPEFCTMAHVPYSPGTGPYRAELSTCGGCRRARVPAVLLATCAKPSRLQSYARAVTVTAVAARIRRAPPAAEPGARDISDQLPFLEYELHKLLLAKLRMQGANALFSLQTQIAIGERCVMALASGTAVRLTTLPPPTPPRIKASVNDKDALEIQKALWDSFTANKSANGYDIAGSADQISNGALPELEGEEPPAPALDLCADKDACVLELDEAEDVETAKTLATRRMHMQVFSSNLKAAPRSPPHAFAQVWRARLAVAGAGGSGASSAAERHVARALDGVSYKLRRLQPCALVAPRFHIELPEDEIQLIVSGTAIPLVDPSKPEHKSDASEAGSPLPGDEGGCNGAGDAEDDIFALDEEQLVKQPPAGEAAEEKPAVVNGQVPALVSLTSLSYVSGSRVVRRVCALRLLFVRETTAVRELGGLSGFLHTFTCEVLAIVRAYTTALGGNALTSFYVTQLMLQDNAHKNQGQCLLSVGGDVVHITY